MNYYCKHCGGRFPSITSLTSASCGKHPSGGHQGRHVLYEGTEKSKYLCKHCGASFPTITSMSSVSCIRHPKGSHKGWHEPAL